MKRILMTAVVLAALTTAAYADGLTKEESDCFDAINSMRVKAGLPAFQFSAELSDASRAWSAKLRTSGRLYHGASYENCARGNTCGVATYRQWMNSPGHRALLLNRSATEAGIGNTGDFWTLRVRTRTVERVAAPAAPVVNQSLQTPLLRSPKHFKALKCLLRRCCCCR